MAAESHSAEVSGELEVEAEGRFKFATIYGYLSSGSYPENFTRADKLALRKRSKFFICEGQDLNYIGGVSSMKGMVFHC